ncbi:MAG: PP2C family protein-serine/threonine phosphatase [Lachnospiraceae bacterium]|nr:PP2C family protein-serine/threonine phosphatase [Lachnospiraceae bacterium]
MDITIIALWSFALFLSTVFAGMLAITTLTPKKKSFVYAILLLGGAALSYGINFVSYSINLYNDAVGIVGQCIFLCLLLIPLHKESTSEKLFVGMTASLFANVSTFMFCGTSDQIIGAQLHLFDGGTPYTVENISLFILIKLIVFTILFVLYMRFARKPLMETMKIAEGQLRNYLIAPAVSVVGFYVVNLVTNEKGIFPSDKAFLPLYGTICLIFIVEYIQMFSSIRWTFEAKKSEAEKERIGADLKVATQIQADMLPTIFPAFPEREEFDIYATMHPAKEVGGDFYDFFLVDETHLALVVADVSGKGVPAALFMVIAKTLIKNRLQMGEEPATVLENVNNQLLEGDESGLFVTVWLMVIDLETGHAVEVNAGHEKLAVCRKGGTYELIKTKHSAAVATIEDMKFKQTEIDLKPGDKLYAYSDGVPEQINEKDELFGADRMLEALNADPDAKPEETLETVRKAVHSWRNTTPQFDDITMLGFHFFGMGGKEGVKKNI